MGSPLYFQKNLGINIKYKLVRFLKQLFAFTGIFFCVIIQANANPDPKIHLDTSVTSTQQQAILFIDKIIKIDSSLYWPNIKPSLFLQNLKLNIHQPKSIYPGIGTNFCGYGALTYLFLLDDPLGYAKLLLKLYTAGNATFGNVVFNPTSAVKKEAGALKFKGILDIHPAEQMWFLCLADHFKGYLNLFNMKYDQGDENSFWASVNYAKFNRMVNGLLNYKIKSRGSDMIHPLIGDLYYYIEEKMKIGKVALFINNRMVHKKNHVLIKFAFPTHYIVVEKISRENGMITLIYWDYGGRTLIQVTPAFLKRITFGITTCTKTEANGH